MDKKVQNELIHYILQLVDTYKADDAYWKELAILWAAFYGFSVKNYKTAKNIVEEHDELYPFQLIKKHDILSKSNTSEDKVNFEYLCFIFDSILTYSLSTRYREKPVILHSYELRHKMIEYYVRNSSFEMIYNITDRISIPYSIDDPIPENKDEIPIPAIYKIIDDVMMSVYDPNYSMVSTQALMHEDHTFYVRFLVFSLNTDYQVQTNRALLKIKEVVIRRLPAGFKVELIKK